MAVVASSEPKEITSDAYQPITDPANVKRFVQDYFSDIPVMQKIAECESHFRQFGSNGAVKRGEKNHYDVGVMQINELYHSEDASELGINIYTIDGNVAFARHLYERFGTKPWNSSSACWNKSGDLAVAPPSRLDN